MKKICILFSVTVFLMTGCGVWRYIGPGESPVERLERQCRELQVDMEKVKRKSEETQSDRRRQYAETKAVLNSLRSEVQALRGEVEQTTYTLNRHVHEYETWRHRQERARPVSKPRAPLPKASIPAVPVSSRTERVETVTPGRDTTGAGVMDEDYLYVTGRQLFDAADYAGARGTFEQFLKLYPKSQQCDNAYFWIGDSYFREKAFEKAILKYQEVIDRFAEGNKVPAALLKQGIAFSKIKDDINARLVLKRLLREFPGSREAKDAGRLLKEL